MAVSVNGARSMATPSTTPSARLFRSLDLLERVSKKSFADIKTAVGAADDHNHAPPAAAGAHAGQKGWGSPVRIKEVSSDRGESGANIALASDGGYAECAEGVLEHDESPPRGAEESARCDLSIEDEVNMLARSAVMEEKGGDISAWDGGTLGGVSDARDSRGAEVGGLSSSFQRLARLERPALCLGVDLLRSRLRSGAGNFPRSSPKLTADGQGAVVGSAEGGAKHKMSGPVARPAGSSPALAERSESAQRIKASEISASQRLRELAKNAPPKRLEGREDAAIDIGKPLFDGGPPAPKGYPGRHELGSSTMFRLEAHIREKSGIEQDVGAKQGVFIALSRCNHLGTRVDAASKADLQGCLEQESRHPQSRKEDGGLIPAWRRSTQERHCHFVWHDV